MDIRTIPIAAGQASGVLISGSGRLYVNNIKETTGAAAASYDLYDGTNATGTLLVPITLSANESSRDYFGKHGIPFRTGVYLDSLSGSFKGSITVEVCEPTEITPIPVVIALSPSDLAALSTQQGA